MGGSQSSHPPASGASPLSTGCTGPPEHSDSSPPDTTPSLGDPATASTETQTSRSTTIEPMPQSKSNLFALIIGINDYCGVNLTRLRGAVSDAKAMKEYLERTLLAPKDHIRILCDGAATRDAIINALRGLRDDTRIKNGDPILIFYAGHGGELDAPPSWGFVAGSKIQCLLPHGFTDTEGGVHGIPDRTVGALIESIAKEKGDNITVIFDCCHSASGTRNGNDGYLRRAVEVHSNLPENIDREIWGARAGHVPSGFAYAGLRSHVLLAACGEKESAYEDPCDGRGLFTKALLETLEEFSADKPTYAEVLGRAGPLADPRKQTPHCEGVNQHRIIFNAKVPARKVRYPIRASGGGKYIIDAGSAHGVSQGAEFTIYGSGGETDVLAVDDAATIRDFETTLITSLPLPNDLRFAKLTRIGEPLPLYLAPTACRDIFLSVADFFNTGSTVPYLCRRVEDVEEAKLEFGTENAQAYVKVLDRRSTQPGFVGPTFPFKATRDNLAYILRAAVHYHWYLDHTRENTNSVKLKVDVSFYKLTSGSYDEYGLPLFSPIEPLEDLCRKDPISCAPEVIDFAIEPTTFYGIKLTNHIPRDLYFNAFLFNSDLSITSYCIQSSAGAPEAPLKRKGTFTIGYGPGETAPFSYSLGVGQDLDVGYLKIFFSTRPIDLSDIAQPSPFSDDLSKDGSNRRGSILPTLPKPIDIWFNMEIPVVQRRKMHVVCAL